jgi:hypothetical protein
LLGGSGEGRGDLVTLAVPVGPLALGDRDCVVSVGVPVGSSEPEVVQVVVREMVRMCVAVGLRVTVMDGRLWVLCSVNVGLKLREGLNVAGDAEVWVPERLAV